MRDGDRGRAGLAVPERKLVEIGPGGLGEAGEEILHRRGFAVMALQVEIHAGAKLIAAKHGEEHPADLGALLVDGRRVEVVDLAIARRPDRVRERAGVLRKLMLPERDDVGDALHRARANVG